MRAPALVGALALALISGAAAADELLVNGGFEDPYLGPFHWSYPGITSYPGDTTHIIFFPDPTLDGWTYDGAAIVNGESGSDWYGGSPRVGFGGRQFAALQSLSTLSQDFISPGGEFSLSWLAGGRPLDPNGTYFGDQDYLIELDGRTVGAFSTFSGEVFHAHALSLGDLAAGSHTLTFQGLSRRDDTAFLDSVSVFAGSPPEPPVVPEPAAWMLLLVGAGLMGAQLRWRGATAARAGSPGRPQARRRSWR